MHSPLYRSTGSCNAAASVAAQCVCSAAQCVLWHGSPLSPHLRFGTALIAHHRTGLIPAHICTGTNSTPRQTTRTVLQPHALCCKRVPPGLQPSATCERSRCGRHTLQPAARCCTAVPLAASDPSNRQGAAGRIAWRVRGTVDAEDWLRRKRGRAFGCPENSRRRESTCHWQSRLG